MHIDMNVKILGMRNEPIKMPDTSEDWTLRHLVQQAMLTSVPGDERYEGPAKAGFFQIAMKAQADEADFTIEEMTTIKDRIGKVFSPLFVGRAFALIEGKA